MATVGALSVTVVPHVLKFKITVVVKARSTAQVLDRTWARATGSRDISSLNKSWHNAMQFFSLSLSARSSDGSIELLVGEDEGACSAELTCTRD